MTFICDLSVIKILVIFAITAVLAMIAYIRRSVVATTFFTFIFVAEFMTVFSTCIAVHRTDIIPANVAFVTTFCIYAVVPGIVASA
ncbi:MAG: hypothetical protein K6F53_07505, partial [Lachnospiraceae bacterium]|nr:hypothetical protein [Lachnospiraceae bacterium]